MPACHVVFYQDRQGKPPALAWLIELRKIDEKAFSKCRAALARLAALGHELRRPEADYLRDGIYELRVRRGTVNYRLLYFFQGRTICVVCHGTTKEAELPVAAINRAVMAKAEFALRPALHTFRGDTDDA